MRLIITPCVNVPFTIPKTQLCMYIDQFIHLLGYSDYISEVSLLLDVVGSRPRAFLIIIHPYCKFTIVKW